MIKDIYNIKKILVAITKDLKYLDSRISDIEARCDTVDVIISNPDPITYEIFEDFESLEDEINELFNLIDRIE